MKYIVMLGDGMADYPIESLGGKTPLAVAKKPHIDAMAQKGIVGMVKTVPEGMYPGSDVANLGALGYDATKCYTGRSPLEAISIGVAMKDDDVAYRCNLVTLSDDEPYADKVMLDYSGGEIPTEESTQLIAALQPLMKEYGLDLYAGVSYRHCLIWPKGKMLHFTAPHDIPGQRITEYLPEEPMFAEVLAKSYEILKNHPVNVARKARGEKPANSMWLWGEGTKPAIDNFFGMRQLNGAMISAVDLLKGIAIAAGMQSIDVEGATGNIKTNFAGKGQAALDALLGGKDFVYIHVEAPDECGHQGDLPGKIRSIELIDEKIVAPLTEGLRKAGEDFSILVMPDHPTPVAKRGHTPDAVPFVLYRSNDEKEGGPACYCEETGKASGVYIPVGYTLMDKLLEK